MAELETVELTFEMPKLETEFSTSLKAALERLGMETAFAGGDFAPMTGETELVIADVAIWPCTSAWTRREPKPPRRPNIVARELATAPPPDEFVVDRPFLLLLRDEGTGALIMAAAIRDPRE